MVTRTMIFRCAGIDTEERLSVVDKIDNIITLDTDEDFEKCKRFDIVSGKCLNDDSSFGCSRRLKL